MKSLFFILILIAISGCGNTETEFKRIGDTCLFVSPYPLKKGKPFSLEVRLPPETIKNINFSIDTKYGDGLTSTIVDGKKVNLNTVLTNDSYVERTVLIKKGEKVLYESKLKITSKDQNIPLFKVEAIGFENQYSIDNQNVNIQLEFRRNYVIENMGDFSILIFSISSDLEITRK